MSSESNNQKWEWNQFPSITNAKDMMEYLKDRPYGHGQYCHYTTLQAIDSILGQQTIWLSDISDTKDANDLQEVQQFAGHEKEYYRFCWSTGHNENLPMWYMYGGMDGKGGRIRLTPAAVKKLNSKGTYKLCKKIDNSDKIETVMELTPGKNMEYTFQDVLYMQTEDYISADSEIKYNTKINRSLPPSEYETLRWQNMYFTKDLIWYYEKETRLLVRLIGDARKALEENATYLVTLTFPDDIKCYIEFAPEVEIENEDYLQAYPNIRSYPLQFFLKSSKYHGKLKMGFCKHCKHPKQTP